MSKIPRVLNARRDIIPPDAIWVDRKTKWGNPFKMGHDPSVGGYTREQCIQLHEHFLFTTPAGQLLLNSLFELTGHDLICWCAPLPCHADILLILANPTMFPDRYRELFLKSHSNK